MAIKTFKGKPTAQLYAGLRVKAFEGFRRQAEKKLDLLDSASALPDLDLPGNRLEALHGSRRGQYSIRINGQWRICFAWPRGSEGPLDVEIVDYH